MNKQIVLNGLLMQLPGLLTADALFRDLARGRDVVGRTATCRSVTRLFTESFGDIYLAVQSLDASQNSLAIRLRFSGYHRGQFAGIPPTGRYVDLPLTVCISERNGCVHMITVDYDAATLLRQLGLLPQE